MRKVPFITILLFSLIFILNGCNNTNCPLNTVAFAHFEFLNSSNNKQYTMVDNVIVTGFTITDVTLIDTLENGTIITKVVKDSLLNDTIFNRPKTNMNLPLSYNSKTTYVIHYNEKMKDTIVVEHTNIPYLENIDCGTMMFYKVNNFSYTTNALDSIVMVNPDINNEEKNNFNIYFTNN